MDAPYRMQLLGPWRYEWLEPGPPAAGVDGDFPPAPGEPRLRMPVDWCGAFGTRAGTVRFCRRFQQPTNLEPHERVWLAFDGVGGAAVFCLNGEELGRLSSPGGPAAFDITARIRRSNELSVEIAFDPAAALPDQPGGLWAPVAIEIRSEP